MYLYFKKSLKRLFLQLLENIHVGRWRYFIFQLQFDLLRMSYTIYISVFIYQLFVIPNYGVSVAETVIYYSSINVWGSWVLSRTLHSREDNSLCIEDMACHQNWLTVIYAFFFWIWNTCLMKMGNIIPDDINNADSHNQCTWYLIEPREIA